MYLEGHELNLQPGGNQPGSKQWTHYSTDPHQSPHEYHYVATYLNHQIFYRVSNSRINKSSKPWTRG